VWQLEKRYHPAVRHDIRTAGPDDDGAGAGPGCRASACHGTSGRDDVAPRDAGDGGRQGVARGRHLRALPGAGRSRGASTGLGPVASRHRARRALHQHGHARAGAVDRDRGATGPAAHAGHRRQRPRPLSGCWKD